ncbi:MAG: DNA cytosine methyltransferase [Gemmatimonadetes bacterium]|nr:DNA cytosine methyltransferase [Gemmatimonadota bacterium]
MTARINTGRGAPRAAEFFAGIGLVRAALERAGIEVVFANDIEASKRDMYAANFDTSDFVLGDVRDIRGEDVPDIELATASFPCVDLSLAGRRRGLAGQQSGMFWEFARVLHEMGDRRPTATLLENVPSFATSHGGEDLRAALAQMNDLGYYCDLLVVDARRFVPQSRARLFIVGSKEPLQAADDWQHGFRPKWISQVRDRHPELRLHALPLRLPPVEVGSLAAVVERLPPSDGRWWDAERVERFASSLSSLQAERLASLRASTATTWATAYRRTRAGRAVWEIRDDFISGCLRTARGGSSKQALVEAGRGRVRVRWMTPREYARLQGAHDYNLDGTTDNQALFGLGDAVCVPAVEWVATQYLRPLIDGRLTAQGEELGVECDGGGCAPQMNEAETRADHIDLLPGGVDSSGRLFV